MNFKDIIGNEEVKGYLNKVVNNNTIASAYLFYGIDGIGKIIIAKEFARKILCNNTNDETCTCKSCTCFNANNHPDFFVLNDNIIKDKENKIDFGKVEKNSIKIEQIRNLTEKVYEKPIISNKKVYIINDAEKMTKEAQNALLKTLEEPPEYVCFILIVSDETSILSTIKSRCTKVKFKRISENEIDNFIKKYGRNYGINGNSNLEFNQTSNIDFDIDSNSNSNSNTKVNINYSIISLADGSIGKLLKIVGNEEKYLKINELINNFSKKDIIDIMADSKLIYDKDNIDDILNYITVIIYNLVKENKKYLNCIQYINECKLRLKFNANFDMTIDNLIFSMYDEINN